MYYHYYKKYKSHKDITILNKYRGDNPEYKSDIQVLTEELINYFEENIPTMFKKKRDIDIANSIIELLKRKDEIENFNKKALYILIREMTNVETSHITKVTNVLKVYYKKLLNEFSKTGTIEMDKKNKLFF